MSKSLLWKVFMYLKDIILNVNALKAKTFKDIILKDIKWYKNIPDISKDITLKDITLIEINVFEGYCCKSHYSTLLLKTLF